MGEQDPGGRVDDALELIERLLRTPYEGALTVTDLRLHPAWDPLREDPRFQELVGN